MITGFYAAILAIIQIVLTVLVISDRFAKRVAFGEGDGSDEVKSLRRRIRAHGNFIETVPMVLLLLLVAELSGAPIWSLHGLALLLIAGRLTHAYALIAAVPICRRVGMAMTLIAMLVGAILCVWAALPVLG